MNGRNCNDDLFGGACWEDIRFDGPSSLHNVDINKLFGELFSAGKRGINTRGRFGPGTEFAETDSEIVIEWELPGVSMKDIGIQVQNNVLTVTAERKGKKQSRRLMLPSTVNGEVITARYENGVLVLTLPKKAEARPRTIPIST